jgi:hypothetical protein
VTVVSLQFSDADLPTLTTGQLPKAVRKGDYWDINGSDVDDDDTEAIFEDIKNFLAVLVAKRNEEIRIFKVAQALVDLPKVPSYSSPPTAQSLLPQARKIIALVEESK